MKTTGLPKNNTKDIGRIRLFLYSDGEVLVGYKAAAQSDHNPKNTVYDAKRFIGKTFSKEELESEAARYPFEVNQIQPLFLCGSNGLFTLNGTGRQ